MQRGTRLLLQTLHGERRYAALSVLAGLAWTATRVALPYFVRVGLDGGVRDGNRDTLLHALVALALTGALTAAFAGCRRYFAQALGARIENALRVRLFSHLLRLDMSFHARRSAGELVTRSASDLQQIQQPFVNVPITFVTGVMFLTVAVVLARIDPLLTAVALLPTLGVMLFARMFMERMGASAGALQRALSSVASALEETIAGIRAVKGLGLEPVEHARVRERGQHVYQAGLVLNRVRAQYLPWVDLCPALALVAVVWLGGLRVSRGELSVGALVQFYSYVVMLIGPLRMAGFTFAQLQRAGASANLIADLLDVVPALAEPDQSAALPTDAPPTVTFEGVHFDYHPTQCLLRGIDFTVGAGETVAVVGTTGSGKSTLVALLARLFDVAAGRITIDGVDVRALSLAHLRSQLGVVFDEPFLFAGSVRDNIAFALPQASEREVEAAARAAGAHNFILAMEQGYDTQVGERGLRLSGGQRQRVSLARALLTDPRILVLDAATSAVDAKTERLMHAELGHVLRGRTTILIADRASTLSLASRVLFLDGGRVADAGSHADLLRRNARYRAVLALKERPHEPAALSLELGELA